MIIPRATPVSPAAMIASITVAIVVIVSLFVLVILRARRRKTPPVPVRHAIEEPSVERHFSLRSVMTLPTYTPAPRANERLIGRAGERGGIDTVVEFPETADEEESRREDAMEALYTVREARRRERSAREQRDRLRAEARERGDNTAIIELDRQDALGRHALPSAENVISQAQSAERGRRISSVAYGDIGVARHDGSRIRSGSDASERPLLDAAADPARGSISLNSRDPSPRPQLRLDSDIPPDYENLSPRTAPPYESPLARVPNINIIPFSP